MIEGLIEGGGRAAQQLASARRAATATELTRPKPMAQPHSEWCPGGRTCQPRHRTPAVLRLHLLRVDMYHREHIIIAVRTY